jgi:phospholipid-binding lipoprotein MlaA
LITNKNITIIKIFRTTMVGLCLGLTTGCSVKTAPIKQDPLEPLNRGIYAANQVADKLFINPVAMVYKSAIPPPFQGSIRNIFSNVGEVPTMINDILQSKPKQFGNDLSRFVINTTLGIAGVFDIAGELGFTKHKEDFGQTLSQWGYKKSMYLVLPIIGSSTVRDTIGMVGNYIVSFPKYLKPKYRNAYYGTYLISTKSDLMGPQQLVESAGVDEYSLVRASYLQIREYDSGGGDNTNNNTALNAEMLGEPPE